MKFVSKEEEEYYNERKEYHKVRIANEQQQRGKKHSSSGIMLAEVLCVLTLEIAGIKAQLDVLTKRKTDKLYNAIR